MRDRMAAMEQGYENLRVLVNEHMRRQTRRLEVIIVVLIAGGAAFSYQQTVLSDQQDKVESVTHANRQLLIATRQSTFVGCTLLANAIKQSGANRSQQSQGPARRGSGSPLGPSHPPRLSPQSRFNTLLVTEIIEHMTPARRHRAIRLQQQIARSGGVMVPNCADVVAHPERVRPIPITP